jgi:hypothetical protein
MKKFQWTAFLMAIYLSSLAQGDITITGTKKISKQMTPSQVLDSLHAHFPDAKAITYYKAPADAAARGWEIAKDDDLLTGEEVDLYTIRFKRDDFRYYGLYKPDGTLVMSKYEEEVSHIPDTIKNSLLRLGELYPGYKVQSKTYYKNTNYSKTKEYYEFVAVNGKNKKKVYYDPDGTLIKVK